MQNASVTPQAKHLVLLGGGHSHLFVLKRLGMDPVPGLVVTLISSEIDTPYSGAMPSYISGFCSKDAMHIDLRPLAQFAGARLIKARVEEIDLEVQRKVIEWYSYKGNDFESPRGETYCERGFRRGDWRVLTITRTGLTADAEEFRFQADLDAYEGRKRVFCKSWDRRIPRDHI